MKKINSIFLIILLSIVFKTDGVNKKINEVDMFLKTYDIQEESISPYFEFKRFVYYDYFELEYLRIKNNYSYLETVNNFYLMDTLYEILPNTNLVLINKQFLFNEKNNPNLVNCDLFCVKKMKNNILINKDVLLAYINMLEDLDINDLYIYSGYRSVSFQKDLYNKANNVDYVAYPRASEHHCGLAIDVSTLEHGLTEHFKYSNTFKLIEKYCMNYGFIIRYPDNKKDITGYNYEPWHLRYVGEVNARFIMSNNITLEEYLFQNFEL